MRLAPNQIAHIRAAIAADLQALTDSIGLQRAALDGIDPADFEQARYCAGKCRDAVNLRAALEDIERNREPATQS